MMTPEEAGAALAADPTFAAMSETEREAEAAALLGSFAEPSDDPLDIAMALEAAARFVLIADAASAEAAMLPPGIEACRMNGADGPACGGNEPIAGNGRCMTCGAQRRVPDNAPAEPVEREEPAKAPIQPEAPKSRQAAAPAEKPRHSITYDPEASFVGRFKEATGATDREVAGMLGMSRATAQAYANGRLAEKVDVGQAQTMIADIENRLLILADLKRDLHVAIGELD